VSTSSSDRHDRFEDLLDRVLSVVLLGGIRGHREVASFQGVPKRSYRGELRLFIGDQEACSSSCALTNYLLVSSNAGPDARIFARTGGGGTWFFFFGGTRRS